MCLDSVYGQNFCHSGYRYEDARLQRDTQKGILIRVQRQTGDGIWNPMLSGLMRVQTKRNGMYTNEPIETKSNKTKSEKTTRKKKQIAVYVWW